jgi:hypothetical protein
MLKLLQDTKTIAKSSKGSTRVQALPERDLDVQKNGEFQSWPDPMGDQSWPNFFFGLFSFFSRMTGNAPDP